MREALVINTGPLIALGKVEALEIIGRLPIQFLTPTEVADEIAAGERLGHPVRVPPYVVVTALSAPLSPLARNTLDAGEAAVIQLAVEKGISHVCIDEWRGRRAAVAAGLAVTGSLGLLGRAKQQGIISVVRPWVEKLAASGVHYHPALLTNFLAAMGEDSR